MQSKGGKPKLQMRDNRNKKLNEKDISSINIINPMNPN